jgi:hypothetical protein
MFTGGADTSVLREDARAAAGRSREVARSLAVRGGKRTLIVTQRLAHRRGDALCLINL